MPNGFYFFKGMNPTQEKKCFFIFRIIVFQVARVLQKFQFAIALMHHAVIYLTMRAY